MRANERPYERERERERDFAREAALKIVAPSTSEDTPVRPSDGEEMSAVRRVEVTERASEAVDACLTRKARRKFSAYGGGRWAFMHETSRTAAMPEIIDIFDVPLCLIYARNGYAITGAPPYLWGPRQSALEYRLVEFRVTAANVTDSTCIKCGGYNL